MNSRWDRFWAGYGFPVGLLVGTIVGMGAFCWSHNVSPFVREVRPPKYKCELVEISPRDFNGDNNGNMERGGGAEQ